MTHEAHPTSGSNMNLRLLRDASLTGINGQAFVFDALIQPLFKLVVVIFFFLSLMKRHLFYLFEISYLSLSILNCAWYS